MDAVAVVYRPHSLDRCRPRIERIDRGIYWEIVIWCPCGAMTSQRQYK